MQEIIHRIAIGAPGFLMAIVFHEWAHAYVALKFGDQTAKMSGRLTLNPSAHIDPLGTIVFPLIGAVLGGYVFGWAKPVPVNSRYFKNIRQGLFWVSFAGPGMNLILGTLCAFVVAFLATQVSPTFYLHKPFIDIFKQAVFINFILAVFNLLPLPPLDGSKMLSAVLSYEANQKYEVFSRYSFIVVLFLLFTNILSYLLLPAIIAGEGLMFFFVKVMA